VEETVKRDITIQTADGVATAGLFRSDAGATKAGVLLYMDAFGLRPALDQMAERLASAGYLVLVPDLYYRHPDHGAFNAKTGFAEESSRTAIRALMEATTLERTDRDASAFLDALGNEGANRIGVVGYCFGGARAITTAATYPDRVAAAASFHGGGLATEAEDSPHRRAGAIRGRVYVGSAGVDGSFPPDQSARLAEALRTAEVDHVIENYVGMVHGWTVPDHNAFDARGAERHWKRLLDTFAETLH
jgi:carboxymethylenebutenolidase